MMADPPTTNDSRSDQSRYIAMAVIVIVVGIIAYANSFRGVFLLDDHTSILSQPRVHNYRIGYLFSDASTRPTTEFTFAINYLIGKENTFSYHLVNLLIHLTTAWLLFDLIQLTMRKSFLDVEPKQALWFAFAVSLIWIAHPLQTQGVTYIVQRGESLASLFYLGCLNFTARGGYSKVQWPWYIAAIICCLFGMGSKQIAFTAPITVFLYDRMFLADSWKDQLRKRGWVYLCFVPLMSWVIAGPIADLASQSTSSVSSAEPQQTADITAGFRYTERTSWEYLRTQAGVILYYLRLSLWPHPLVLDYAWPVSNDFAEYASTGAIVSLLLIASCIGYLRGSPLGFVGLAFFLILAPTSSVMPIKHFCVEHRMYLPLACVIICLVVITTGLINRIIQQKKVKQLCFKLLLGVCVLALVTRTIIRNEDYSSGVKIWAANVKYQPKSALAQSNYAHHLLENNQIEAALIHAREGVKLQKNLANAYINLAAAEIQYGMLQADRKVGIEYLKSALHHLLTAEELYKRTGKKNGLALTYKNLAAAYFMLGDYQNSLKYCHLAVQENPKDADSYHVMGDCLALQKRFEESYAAFQLAAQLGLSKVDLFYGWGQVCRQLGSSNQDQSKIEEAVRHFSIALKLNDNFAPARFHRALALKQIGRCDLVVQDCMVLLSTLDSNSNLYRGAKQLIAQCRQ